MQIWKKITCCITGAMFSSFGVAVYALPFSVVPKGNLPTAVVQGSSVTALYTIKNNTGSLRANNYIKYLPPNVTQVTSDPAIPDLCGKTFTLQASGQAKDSCTLKLLVDGAVNANDPEPHHHLFACFPGGLTCAGTEFPLNVGVEAPAIVAVGNYTDNAGATHGGIAASQDEGLTWTQTVLPIQKGFIKEVLNANSCVGTRCVMVGSSTKAKNSFPAVEISENLGKTVTTRLTLTTGLPSGFSAGQFNGVSCVDNQCVAVGEYTQVGSGEDRAGTALSDDGGKTWTQQALDVPPDAPFMDGRFFGVSCRKDFCLAAGEYAPSLGKGVLVFATTTDKTNWDQTIVFLPQFPPRETTGTFFGADCPDDTRCIVVGGSFTLVVPTTRIIPAFIVGMYNRSVGKMDITVLQIPAEIKNDPACQFSSGGNFLPIPFTQLKSVSCMDDKSCVAVGQYSCSNENTNTQTTFEMIVKTTDGGVTWTQTVINKIVDKNNVLSDNSVFCTSSFCITAGGIVDKSTFSFVSPLVNRSTDGGQTWVQEVLPLPQKPFQINNAGLNGLSGTAS